jgi:hypothetical protein
MYTLFVKMKEHGHNLAHILFEVACFTKQNHEGLTCGGVDAEAEAIVAKGCVATHFKSANANRWCIHQDWAQLVAIWLQPQALEGWGAAAQFRL